MKKLILTLCILVISTHSFANCNALYEQSIEHRLNKIHRLGKVSRISTGSMFGVNTAFWGTMGVILVGPAGVLIGLQFGAFAAVPTYGVFYTIKQFKKLRLNSELKVLNLLKLSEGQDVDNSDFYKLYHKAKRYDSNLTEEELKTLITNLNQEEAFCTGKVASFRKFKKIVFNHL